MGRLRGADLRVWVASDTSPLGSICQGAPVAKNPKFEGVWGRDDYRMLSREPWHTLNLRNISVAKTVVQ